MDEDEVGALDAFACQIGVDRAKAIRELVRRAGCNDGPTVSTSALSEVVAAVKEVFRQDAAIGNNVNQVAHSLNTYIANGDMQSVGDWVMSGIAQDNVARIADAIEEQNRILSTLIDDLKARL